MYNISGYKYICIFPITNYYPYFHQVTMQFPIDSHNILYYDREPSNKYNGNIIILITLIWGSKYYKKTQIYI